MNQGRDSSNPKKFSGRETIIVIGLLLVILVLNLATSLKYPMVWMDEAMYTDPAASLALGKGFTSTAWYAQADQKFWAGNVPLHELILSEWIRVFGFSPLAVRSINYVWFILGTFLLFRFCVHFRLVENTRWRVLLIVLLAAGSGLSFSYRSSRPDMICYFLVTLAMAAATLPKSPVRYLCLAGVGFFFPWAGLPMLPLLVAATGLLLVFLGVRAALNCIFIGLGAGAGLVALYFFYQSHHAWHAFVDSITRHVVGEQAQAYRHAQWSAIPEVFMRDRSAPFLLVLGVVLLIRARSIHDSATAKMIVFALAAGIGIPLWLHLTGVFPIYYGWMAALPVCLLLCHALSRMRANSVITNCAIAVLLAAAIFIGLPARLLVVALNTGQAPYPAFDKFLSSQISASDRAYVSFAAFYPAKRTAQKAYFLPYLRTGMTPDEKKDLTVLILDPEFVSYVTNNVPGNWQKIAEFDGKTGPSLLPAFLAEHIQSGTRKRVYDAYHFMVFRKATEMRTSSGP